MPQDSKSRIVPAVISVVVFVAIVIAIALPWLFRPRIDYEIWTVADLRTFQSVQGSYQAANQGYFESRLECLLTPRDCIPGYSGPTFVDAKVFQPIEHRYIRKFYPGRIPGSLPPGASKSSTEAYAIVAGPEDARRPAGRPLCADASGRICTAAIGAANDLVDLTGPDAPRCSRPSPTSGLNTTRPSRL